MKDEQAVPPSQFKTVQEIERNDKEVKPFLDTAKREEREIVTLSDYPEFETYKKVILGQMEELKNEEIKDGETVEMYGFRMMANRKVIKYLNHMINLPEAIRQTIFNGNK